MDIDALAAGFMALFSGLERAHGSYVTAKKHTAGEKLKGRAVTEHAPVTLSLWRDHLEGARGLGIIPIRDDGTVLWAAIDIDSYKDFDLVRLERTLLELRLPLVVARSKSGGAHLYLFCAEPIAARYVRGKLAEWAVLIGHHGCEIFPKQDEIARPGDVGNWINMPYFNHTQTSRPVIWDGEPLSAAAFLEKAASRKVTKAMLDAFTSSPNTDAILADGPPCLQHLCKTGFPRGTRNKGLFNIGVLARFAAGDDWQAKVDEFNRAYMQPPLSTKEVSTTIKSLSRKEYFYTCSQDPIASVCTKDICRERKYGIGSNDPDSAPVVIDSIKVIKSTPPIFVVGVEGVSFDCSSADLLSQSKFQLLVLEHAQRVIPLIKSAAWAKMINEKLEVAEVLVAPEDAGPEGQFVSHLEAFCSTRAGANSLDEILLGRPFIDADQGRTFFRSPDLLRYLEQQHFRGFTERQIWAILKRRGAAHHQFSMKGKCVTAWSVPSFRKQTEEFKVPQVEGDDL